MGQCSGNLTQEEKVEKKRNRTIEAQNAKDRRAENKKIKLLLLGTGESGKSTIFKQVRKLYGDNFTESELRTWTPRVHENINKQILAIYKATKKLGIGLENADLGIPFDKYDFTTPIDADIASKMKAIWVDKGFQRAWERRAEYQVLDCIEYYMQEIDRIASTEFEYIPTFQDIVYCRVRTSGIVQENFRMYGAPFEMYDVGGQRSERKKWLNCFDNVTTVLFVAAINEYDQVLFEDAKTDRIKEAINTWQDIVNREEFQNIGFVLFLNKYDLFRDKLKVFPFKVDGPDGRNQDYEGPDAMAEDVNFEEAVAACATYMEEKFMDVVDPRTGLGQISVHFTIATDTNNMEKVFNMCREQILRRNLHTSGFGPQTN